MATDWMVPADQLGTVEAEFRRNVGSEVVEHLGSLFVDLEAARLRSGFTVEDVRDCLVVASGPDLADAWVGYLEGDW